MGSDLPGVVSELPGVVDGVAPAPRASGAVAAGSSLEPSPLLPAPPEPLAPGSAVAEFAADEFAAAESAMAGGRVVSAARLGATSTRMGAAVPGFRSSMAQPAAQTASATHPQNRARAAK